LRVPLPLAWALLALTFFTAALLRRFHEETPTSPYAPPVVGSLLFAAIFFLLLVSAREQQRGAVRGRGVRLGSLTPILLMLLLEKWFSLTLYPPLFYAWARSDATHAELDAQYPALFAVLLVGVCLVVAFLSRPTARKTWRRARPSRWPAAAAGTAAIVVACYALLGGLAWLLGGSLRLEVPAADRLFWWIVVGQALLAFAEELYYRGLLLNELERLSPRLGVRTAASRRWVALGFTSLLFGVEHLVIGPPWTLSLQRLVFTVSLGLLFGILVMASANLHFAAGVHAWINWLLLGAAPRFVDETGQSALPSGTYIGLTLALAFVLAFAIQRRRLLPVAR
jgi:membrane protease YdiL (CAAX protease family)